MNDVIHETVLTTVDRHGRPHVAPMGVRYPAPGQVLLMPFKPSRTLENLLETRHAALNIVTDTRVFAGCVTGRRTWAVVPMSELPGVRLACALRHLELHLGEVADDPQRPVLRLGVRADLTHAPFDGLNRAQAAVIEAAVLVSRLHLLPRAKVDAEMAYLRIAIDKTASAAEHEAWGWLEEAIARHRAAPSTQSQAA
ncbi:hypothetical protein C7444_13217 [Sphaerotilus hippei]|uniref:Tetrahydromethanopterin synthesis protein n=1 Tax=Sphaerotilus hippei TaxID=744406 RepID=A0A318H283_9BURK|nr:DUF447 domain-containing protein [Sphaerotilus hippei]PXW91573.1 hypothetical protein C7444_13217 [Sphaerotilus hippei]